MGKNNDLDMQTFQIYQEEETDMAEMVEPVKKPTGIKGVFANMKKKKTGERPQKNTTVSSSKEESSSSGGMSDVTKGVLIGLVVVVLVIVLDVLNVL